MLPVWDVIFGTYEMPDDNRDVKFGVAGMKHMEMDTCWKLYSVPFVKAARRLKRGRKPSQKQAVQLTPPQCPGSPATGALRRGQRTTSPIRICG